MGTADEDTQQQVSELLKACGIVQPRPSANAEDVANKLAAIGYNTLPPLAHLAL